jgi:hypothetical protein
VNGSRTELACEEVAALLPLVADGALDAQGDPALFDHLARCNECQDALASHDLVDIALECTRATAPRAGRQRSNHLWLPWPTALAASLAAAAGLWAWLNLVQGGNPAKAAAPAAQVVQVSDSNGHPVYVVVQGDQVTVIDTRAIDGKPTDERERVQPVKLKK